MPMRSGKRKPPGFEKLIGKMKRCRHRTESEILKCPKCNWWVLLICDTINLDKARWGHYN